MVFSLSLSLSYKRLCYSIYFANGLNRFIVLVYKKTIKTHLLRTAHPLTPSLSLRCYNAIYFHTYTFENIYIYTQTQKKKHLHIQGQTLTTQHLFFLYILTGYILKPFLLLLFLFFHIPGLVNNYTSLMIFAFFFVHSYWCTPFYKNFPMIIIGTTYKDKIN